MTYEQIIASLKDRKFPPMYFLAGEEHFYMDRISDYAARNILSEEQQAFDRMLVYAKRETSVASIIDTARRFPMAAPYQVLIVREAHQIASGWDNLIYYLKQPQPKTVLVICYGKKLDKRLKLYKALSSSGCLSEFEPIKDYKIPEWINGYCRENNRSITPPAAVMLSDFLGNDLGKIANELDKLFILTKDLKGPLTPEIIEKNVGISRQFNTFELQAALTEGDILKANRIVDYFDKNPKASPMVLTIASLYSYFLKIFTYHALVDKSQANVASELKINPYFVKDYEKAARRFPPKKVSKIFSWLRTYDLKSKGFGNVSVSQGDMLKELVYHIMH